MTEILPRLHEALQEQHRFAEAAAAVRRGFEGGDYRRAMRLGGDVLAAEAEHRYVTASDVATMYLPAGDHDRALDWLERAYRMRDPNLPYLRRPCYDPIRGEPRFAELMRKMKLDG